MNHTAQTANAPPSSNREVACRAWRSTKADNPVDQLLNMFPISREWLHTLLRRLDSLIPIYQLAAASAEEFEIDNFCWYRTIPLDAAIRFVNGDWAAIHREGPLATLFYRRRRMKPLVERIIARKKILKP